MPQETGMPHMVHIQGWRQRPAQAQDTWQAEGTAATMSCPSPPPPSSSKPGPPVPSCIELVRRAARTEGHRALGWNGRREDRE